MIWWLVVEALGIATLPASAYLFRHLPDRGYGLSKAIGIILPAYIFWLLASVGALDNARASIALVVATLGITAWVAAGEGRREVARLWRERRELVIVVEVLFALAFGAWCVVRAYNPEIAATEKPMEITFLNGVLRSETFPPVDPWLSGYSISYYYFGYVMMAMLAKLTSVPSAIAFNLAIALLFALTVVGAFTLAYDLAAGRLKSNAGRGFPRGPVACGLLGSLFVAVMGNLEGLLEFTYARAALPLSFWQWLNIQNLDKPYLSQKWYPTDWYWWFRASRVIGDFDATTKAARDYTINEFPFFSFLLGDLHPHVLALPFAFVALGLALSLLKSNEEISLRGLLQKPSSFALWSVIIGGLGFLNSWDMPTYLVVLTLAFALNRRLAGREWIKESVLFGLALLVASMVLYAPFYLGFSSQVKGLGIVLQRTRLHQFLVFWGPFLFFAVAFLVIKFGELYGKGPRFTTDPSAEGRRHGEDENVGHGNVAAPHRGARDRSESEVLVLASRAGVAEMAIHPARAGVPALVFIGLLIVASAAALVAFKATALVALVPIVLAAYRLLAAREWVGREREEVFVVLLIFAGMGLLAIIELIFVLDFFGNRMNTVFKVYYQAWQMLAVASAYVVYCLLRRRWPMPVGWLFRGGGLLAFAIAVLLAVGSLAYPVAATLAKTGEFAGRPVLDGMAFMANSERGDYAAINWLNQNVVGTPVILEGVGGSYSQFGRVSAFTGLPTVVGWDGHELQWRGTGEEAGKRKSDVATIYQTPDEQTARSLLAKYGVTYVYVGRLERETYGRTGGIDTIARLGEVVYRTGDVTIYKVRSD